MGELGVAMREELVAVERRRKLGGGVVSARAETGGGDGRERPARGSSGQRPWRGRSHARRPARDDVANATAVCRRGRPPPPVAVVPLPPVSAAVLLPESPPSPSLPSAPLSPSRRALASGTVARRNRGSGGAHGVRWFGIAAAVLLPSTPPPRARRCRKLASDPGHGLLTSASPPPPRRSAGALPSTTVTAHPLVPPLTIEKKEGRKRKKKEEGRKK
uniref:Uncharacterized protein n=1 Tax=Oryza sativa subsp. japonica TaxID=39947 RepID=Q6ERT6_ORYSJ|nr:hypothetical protein [Oryza sativa Japonica Group]